MTIQLKPVDKVEILTLQDNFIDMAAFDGTSVVQRAMPFKNLEMRTSVLAEHGFSALVSVTAGGTTRSVLFDFGFSELGALTNAEALGVDLTAVEALVLSHGHMDHHGGLPAFLDRLGRTSIDLVLHPAAFRPSRYIKVSEQRHVRLPSPDRKAIERLGARVVEARAPHAMLDDALLFLGEIPRRTSFEKGFARAFYEQDGESRWDPIEDDSAIVACVKGRGLVVLSGCAHAGIVNTLLYAREVTGDDRVLAAMGGFHLTGADCEPAIAPTTAALTELGPRYVVPTHCTGHKAVAVIERTMPGQFLLNMSGTRMVFAAHAA
jgi:7,8-dihydropterin-6-yl-methyl-4-(beta-D-ribofuranosyl)aminobenzene 5'-phosphate synthase